MAVKKYRAKKIISKLLFGILVLVIVIPILFPLYFVLISSFKNMAQVYIMPPKLFGFKPILDNYIYIFKTQHYGTYMMNSTIVAVASTALSLLLGVPAAYAIARYKMGKANTAILTARLLPNISILLPYYFIFSKLRMIDTYGVLILSHMVLSLPLIVWIMVGFFSDLPLELEEAAIVDGANVVQEFIYVKIPYIMPVIVANCLLVLNGSLRSFDVSFLLTKGGPSNASELMSTYMYKQAFTSQRYGYGSAVAMAIVILCLVIGLGFRKMTAERE